MACAEHRSRSRPTTRELPTYVVQLSAVGVRAAGSGVVRAERRRVRVPRPAAQRGDPDRARRPASLLALRQRRGRCWPSSALLGLTPIAWFTFGFVSPSAVAIGGGLALWTGLLVDRSRLATWLTVAGWAAVLLPRRDGPVWATLIVLAVLPADGDAPVRALAPARAVGAVDRRSRSRRCRSSRRSSTATFDSNLLLPFAPLALVVVEFLARMVRAHRSRRRRRRALVAYTRCRGRAARRSRSCSIGPGDVARRDRCGSSSPTRATICGNWSGILGWLRHAGPGGRRVPVLGDDRRPGARRRARVPAVGVRVSRRAWRRRSSSAWLLELGQSADYGNYWQGRYTMPFAVGLPLVLAWRPVGAELARRPADADRRLGSWVVSNVAFVAAQQRWGVGVNGSWYPWDWDTWGAPVVPWLLVLVHAGATRRVLAACCTSRAGAGAGMTNRRRLLSLIVIAAIPFVARWVHHEFRAPAGTTEDFLPYALLSLLCVAIVAILEAPPRTSSVTRVFVESTVAALSCSARRRRRRCSSRSRCRGS